MEVKKLTSLIIEPTNHCNLNCSICPSNNGMKRKKGTMSLELFKKAIDGSRCLEHLCLHNWGEPILNRDLFKMIDYAHDKGVQYTVFNTNGILLDETIVDSLIESPLSILRISIDGGPAVHKKIRGIDYAVVEKNIFNLIQKRNRAKSALRIGIVMVVDEQSEEDCESFYNKWANLADHARFQPKLVNSKRSDPCPEWFGKDYGKLTILWDGTVVPCCADYEGILKLGNIMNETVDSIWEGFAIKRLRKRHINRDLPETCAYCNEYQTKYAEKRFVTVHGD